MKHHPLFERSLDEGIPLRDHALELLGRVDQEIQARPHVVEPCEVLEGLEEGPRGAGGHLYNGHRERFMSKYDAARMERSTRDIVARSSYLEIMEGRGSPSGLSSRGRGL